MYQCVGKQYGPEMVTVDRQVFHDYDFDVLIDKYNEDLEKYKNGMMQKIFSQEILI